MVSLSWFVNQKFSLNAGLLVGRAGIEPATNGLKVRCSTG
jgi:hypothetical protein